MSHTPTSQDAPIQDASDLLDRIEAQIIDIIRRIRATRAAAADGLQPV